MSREKCQIARNYLIFIITLSKELNNSNYIQHQIPKDLQTVIKKLGLTPELNQYVCCPKCYFKYDIEVAPHHCQYKNLPNSPPCGAMLFCQSRFIRALYHLAFSLFTDWFNPLSNKAAGKQVSLGVLALNCLKLPPSSRWKAENTFIAGLVPEPSQPNMVTINKILRVFIDEMIQLNSGIFVQTPKYPNGRMVVVCLGCLIGDLVANHKVSGFALNSATWFCSSCECTKAEIQQLELGRLQQKFIVKDYSLGFKDLTNKAERTRMVKKTGIRWSGLN
ncbi:hypothetical protein O181_030569 [Austropuccinia psidii MF-1]|uniref:Uncharacterized protein n=1 Tax=Austropuccinia psidii MF-1 TaxID=1389203 RepID=A0A9Q3H5P3_9BASI|nr:hypothetical protein [Austropuccinia psidii MF-1]